MFFLVLPFVPWTAAPCAAMCGGQQILSEVTTPGHNFAHFSPLFWLERWYASIMPTDRRVLDDFAIFITLQRGIMLWKSYPSRKVWLG